MLPIPLIESVSESVAWFDSSGIVVPSSGEVGSFESSTPFSEPESAPVESWFEVVEGFALAGGVAALSIELVVNSAVEASLSPMAFLAITLTL